MKRILLPLCFSIFCFGYLGWHIYRAEQEMKKEIKIMRCIISRCELKGRWIDATKDKLEKVDEIDKVRILSVVWECGERYNVPKDLLLAVAKRESDFDKGARGKDGEIGLFQIMPEIGILISQAYNLPIRTEGELFEIENNTIVASLFLRDLIKMYGEERALSHYNHGRNGLRERGKKYAREVLKLRRRYDEDS